MSRLWTLAFVGLLVAACGGAGSSPTPGVTQTPGATPTQGATQTPAATPTQGATQTPAGSPAAATVNLATTSLGTILVGSNGKTLYGFTPDQTAGKPTCNGGCAGAWPPLTVTGDFTVGTGLDKTIFKLVARDDGSMQLQVGDYPLYYYAPDANAGDTSGQGVGGKWFVVGADGQLIQTT